MVEGLSYRTVGLQCALSFLLLPVSRYLRRSYMVAWHLLKARHFSGLRFDLSLQSSVAASSIPVINRPLSLRVRSRTYRQARLLVAGPECSAPIIEPRGNEKTLNRGRHLCVGDPRIPPELLDQEPN